jgi:hypothetical protein
MSGDFLQLTVCGGTGLCKAMYCDMKNQAQRDARALFALFKVFDLETQHRAPDCVAHQNGLQAFRVLPKDYPSGVRWCKKDMSNYTPMTDDLIRVLTTELSEEDLESNPSWRTEGRFAASLNADRAMMVAASARVFAKEKNKLVVRWRRETKREITPALAHMLYDETKHPEMFGYFVEDGPGQILENTSGNVYFQAANGTWCWMVGLAYIDTEKHRDVQVVLDANRNAPAGTVVDVPHAPSHILVELYQLDAELIKQWPKHLNLSLTPDKSVVIPIGLMALKQPVVKIGTNASVKILSHAVGLALSCTSWKLQGSTMPLIATLMEPSGRCDMLSYELLYVNYSRVKEDKGYRCLPLSFGYDKSALKKLRPNIFTVKWRMDIDEDGYWNPGKARERRADAAESTRPPKRQVQPKAAMGRKRQAVTAATTTTTTSASYTTTTTRQEEAPTSKRVRTVHFAE